MFKKALSLFLVTISFLTLSLDAYAYVSVKGYYKSNGTYVAPYVRSNPNGLKYDNYGYTPSQGLYNKTYGTKGSTWDTPTWTTDPDYYTGKSLYESGQTSTSTTSTQEIIPINAKANTWGSWSCNSGYSKNYSTSQCDKVIIPANGKLDYLGSGWTCNSGYSKNYSTSQCDKVIIPANGELNYLGNGWTCNSGYSKDYINNKCVKK